MGRGSTNVTALIVNLMFTKDVRNMHSFHFSTTSLVCSHNQKSDWIRIHSILVSSVHLVIFPPWFTHLIIFNLQLYINVFWVFLTTVSLSLHSYLEHHCCSVFSWVFVCIVPEWGTMNLNFIHLYTICVTVDRLSSNSFQVDLEPFKVWWTPTKDFQRSLNISFIPWYTSKNTL